MCNCGKTTQQEQQFTVTYPNGKTETVQGETAAKIKITVAGGGRYEATTR